MGISLYTRPSDTVIFAIVSRKKGPETRYLWQYQLSGKGKTVQGTVVRKFGVFSGKKEIEAIAVDNKAGYVYYADEQHGIHKYHADPDSSYTELALFGTADFLEDNEGISIYPTGDYTGYILISNQQKNSFMVYPREGDNSASPHKHTAIAEIPVSTIESDGSKATHIALNNRFPKGLFVAMSDEKVFHYYDWQEIQKRIDAQRK